MHDSHRLRAIAGRLNGAPPPRKPRKPKPPVRLSRKNRAVLLVLLTGAPGLSGYPLGQASRTGPATVYPLLERLEQAGWVRAEWGPYFNGTMRRRFYSLTPKGRTEAYRVLGLEMPGVPPAMMPAPVAGADPSELARLRTSQRVHLARLRLAEHTQRGARTDDEFGLARSLRAVLEAIDGN